MKNKIQYIIIALLAIYCFYLHWQLSGIKEVLEVLIQINYLHGDSIELLKNRM